MRLLPATLLVGAASAAVPMQQVMGDLHQQSQTLVQEGSDFMSKPLQKLQDQFKTLSDEARLMWKEVSDSFPNLDQTPMLSLPKKHTRRPDSHWDSVVRGADVQSVWVEGSDDYKHRELDGKLEAYDLRVKKVDPSSLGIDPKVKQYSGYLDDNENDKHLFYCKFDFHRSICMTSNSCFAQGSLSPVMTPQMTPLSSG
jgi:cathepsin A (carboxypeptidase C)